MKEHVIERRAKLTSSVPRGRAKGFGVSTLGIRTALVCFSLSCCLIRYKTMGLVWVLLFACPVRTVAALQASDDGAQAGGPGWHIPGGSAGSCPIASCRALLGAHLLCATDTLHLSQNEIFLWQPPQPAFGPSLQALLFQRSVTSPHPKQ